MDFLDDPTDMTPEVRLAEVAAILAAGFARMLKLRLEPAPLPDSRSSTEKLLDCSGGPLPLCDQRWTNREPAPLEVAR